MGDRVFGERTRVTAGSDDFANNDFFPDLGKLILDDMCDDASTPAVLFPLHRM